MKSSTRAIHTLQRLGLLTILVLPSLIQATKGCEQVQNDAKAWYEGQHKENQEKLPPLEQYATYVTKRCNRALFGQFASACRDKFSQGTNFKLIVVQEHSLVCVIEIDGDDDQDPFVVQTFTSNSPLGSQMRVGQGVGFPVRMKPLRKTSIGNFTGPEPNVFIFYQPWQYPPKFEQSDGVGQVRSYCNEKFYNPTSPTHEMFPLLYITNWG